MPNIHFSHHYTHQHGHHIGDNNPSQYCYDAQDKHGHINPNALKDINVVLEALVGPNAGAIQLVTPNETRLGYK